jgi:methyl-accepting chemotaxis protein
MRQINERASSVAARVEMQNIATTEIARNVADAAAGANSILGVLGDVKEAVTKTHGSAQVVLSSSEAVEQAAGQLRGKVAGFLDKVAV